MVLTSQSFGSGLGEATVKVAAAKSMKKLVNCIFGSFEKKSEGEWCGNENSKCLRD
jgi:hypothetical protein